MTYGFLLIPPLVFAPGKEEWASNYAVGKYSDTRLAHKHGNLFAFINILIGHLRFHFNNKLKNISWLALTGLLMPLGIFYEIHLGLPLVLVLIGAVAIMAFVIWLGIAFLKLPQLNT